VLWNQSRLEKGLHHKRPPSGRSVPRFRGSVFARKGFGAEVEGARRKRLHGFERLFEQSDAFLRLPAGECVLSSHDLDAWGIRWTLPRAPLNPIP
jgi:hypothetical protein